MACLSDPLPARSCVPACRAGSQVDRKPLAMVQLTQAFMLFAAISGAFVFLAHVRGFCSRTKEVGRTTRREAGSMQEESRRGRPQAFAAGDCGGTCVRGGG